MVLQEIECWLDKALLVGAGLIGYGYEGARKLAEDGRVDFTVGDTDVNITASNWNLIVNVNSKKKKSPTC